MKKPPLLLVSFGVLVVFLVWYWQRRQNKLPYLEASIPATSAPRALSDEEPLILETPERKKQAAKMPEILPSERNRPRPMPQPSTQPSAVPMPSVEPSSDGSTKLVAFSSDDGQAETPSAVAELESDELANDGQQEAEQIEQAEQHDDQQEEAEQIEQAEQHDDQQERADKQAEEKAEAERKAVQANQTKPSERLNPNTASLQELIDLPGIGPVLAKRIIDYRDAHGLFKTIDDLVVIQGIGPNNIRQFDFLLAIDQDEAAE